MVNSKKAQMMPSATMPVRPVRVSAAKPAQSAQPAKGPAAIAVLVLLLAVGFSIYFGAQLMSSKTTATTPTITIPGLTNTETQPETTRTTPLIGSFADKFEWAEALGCGPQPKPYTDNNNVGVRACINTMYSDVKLSKSDVMTFNQWLATQPDLATMNVYGQQNRYADYLWSVKLNYVTPAKTTTTVTQTPAKTTSGKTCGDYCVGNTPSKCVGSTVSRGDNNCNIVGCTTTCWGQYRGSYSGTDCGYTTEDTCVGSTGHRSDLPVLPG
jgi:hypothetical protein